MARAVGEACVRLHLADERVCRQITELFREDFIRALQESLLWPSEACAMLVGPSCGKFDLYAPWNITLPKVPKPPVVPPSLPKPGSPQSKVLFLTDIHWDNVSFCIASEWTVYIKVCVFRSMGLTLMIYLKEMLQFSQEIWND